jgi:hypothetical protein
MPELLHLPEPSLLFGYEQAVEDPRDGLTLFGPLDGGKPYGIRAGAIGTPEGLRRFENWVQKIQGLVTEPEASVARPPFPGFEAAFGIPWSPTPTVRITEPSLFPEDNILAQPYRYDVHFHNQLKARLLEHNTPTRIIRESTIAHHEFLDRFGNPTRKLGNSQSETRSSVDLSRGQTARLSWWACGYGKTAT